MTDHKTNYYTWRCYENSKGQLEVDNLNGISIEVRYCPFCGRKSSKRTKLKQLKMHRY